MKINLIYPLSIGLVSSLGVGAANFATSLQNTTQAQTFQSENSLVENGIEDLSTSLQQSQLYVDKLSDSNTVVVNSIPELTEKLDNTKKSLIYSYEFYQNMRNFLLNDSVYDVNYEKVTTENYPVLVGVNDLPREQTVNNKDKLLWVSPHLQKSLYIPVTYGKTYTEDENFGIKTSDWNTFDFSTTGNDIVSRTFNKVLITPTQFDQLITKAAETILKSDSLEAKQFIREYFVIQYKFKYKSRFQNYFGINGLWTSHLNSSSFLKDWSKTEKNLYNVAPDSSSYSIETDPNTKYDPTYISETPLIFNDFANSWFPDAKRVTKSNMDYVFDFTFDFFKKPGLKTEIYPNINNKLFEPYTSRIQDNNHTPLTLNWNKRKLDINNSNSIYSNVELDQRILALLSWSNSLNYFDFNNNPLRKNHYNLRDDIISRDEEMFAKESNDNHWVGTFYLSKNVGAKPAYYKPSSSGYPIGYFGTGSNRNNYQTILKKEAEFANDYSTIKIKEYNLAIWINPDNGALIMSYVLDNGQTVPNLEVSDFQINFMPKKIYHLPYELGNSHVAKIQDIILHPNK